LNILSEDLKVVLESLDVGEDDRSFLALNDIIDEVGPWAKDEKALLGVVILSFVTEVIVLSVKVGGAPSSFVVDGLLKLDTSEEDNRDSLLLLRFTSKFPSVPVGGVTLG